MNNRLRLWSSAALCLIVGLATSGRVVRAQTFSADLVSTKSGGQATAQRGHVYVSHDKVRIETPEFAGNFFIVDGDRNAVWFVRPKQWVFMDAKQSSPLTQVFVTVDPADPCAQWRLMETIAGAIDDSDEWRCVRVGADVLGGRDVVKYEVRSRRDRLSYRWIDPRRAFPIKYEDDEGAVVAVRDIADAPQAAALFAIPPVYQMFDPRVLIERIKQSDVWVEPPAK